MKMTRLLMLLGALFMLVPDTASAACVNPIGAEGTITYNGDQNVPQVCTSAGWVVLGVLNPSAGGGGCTNPTGVESEVIYNGDIHAPQYCDGDDWRAMIGTVNGCNAPQDCSNIGDVCDDGSLFAGFVAEADGSCRLLFAPDVDQSTDSQWHTASNDFTAMQELNDGRVIRDWVIANEIISDFPAIQTCENLYRHGFQDWYLPARNEAFTVLGNLWPGVAALGTEPFWTATQSSAYNSFYVRPWAVATSSQTTGTYSVRCIRSVDSVGSGLGGGTSVTFGYLVQSSTTWNGNLGGLSGADAKCLSDLQTYDWLGKDSAGTLTADRVKSFLCDKTTCNQAEPDAVYFTAVANAPTKGGLGFKTDSQGRGFGFQLFMVDSISNDSFEGALGYWSNRSNVDGAELWSNVPRVANDNNTCSDWSDGTVSFTGRLGNMDTNDANRWSEVLDDCNISHYLMCLVSP